MYMSGGSKRNLSLPQHIFCMIWMNHYQPSRRPTTAAAGERNSLLDVTPMHTTSYARALAPILIRIMNLSL
jgi:hypothetical protein